MKRPVIVCIDDEPDVLHSLKIELKKAIGDRCIIETAEGGEDALELLADLQADEYEIALVVADYIMPDIKGDELLRKIHERSPHTMKIMLTGQANLEAIANAIRYARLYRYIAKPWQNEDLQLTVVEAVHSYLQDQKLSNEIIKGREANKELKIVNEKLAASEKQLGQFLEALPLGVSVYNPDGSLAYLNHAAQDLLGTETAIAMTDGKFIVGQQPYNPDTDQLYFPENFPILRALQGESVIVEDVEIIQYGLIISLEINATPIYDPSGNITYALAVIQDISKRKELEKFLANYQRTLESEITERTVQLEEAVLAAEAANKAKSTFLANMSHELRTPLNAILGFTQIMESSANRTAEDRENIRIIHRSGEHLLVLINQALDLSKIEAGQMIVIPRKFDLYNLLDELQNMFQRRSQDRDLQLVFLRSPNVPQYVEADEIKLRQVLLNLISNAIKFTETGGVSLRVKKKSKVNPEPPSKVKKRESQASEAANFSLTAAETNSKSPIVDDVTVSNSCWLQFEIEDTGVGIAPEELERVFEAFVQTSSGQKMQNGTGLGLTISRQFVRLMGGDITVESEVEQGSIFRFEIPVNLVNRVVVPAPTIQYEAIGLEANQPSYRILIVDDRPDNRLLLLKLLSPLGFLVEEASNGCEAITLWESWQPHLIFMDLRMPVMDGYEATVEIKAKIKQREEARQTDRDDSITNPDIHSTKIVALTASIIDIEKRSFALLVGCDDFISKPFRKTEILDTLKKHLGVNYIYSDEIGDRRGRSDSASTVILSSVPKLPAEWTEKMKQAIRSADFDLIAMTIEELQNDNPAFAQLLQERLDNFDYQKIINLINEAQESSN